jgi:hypothetical protein
MHLDRYLFSVSLKTETLTEYEFISIGPKGYIKKLIRFTKVGFNCYNLAFGDIDKKTGIMVDNITSGNNDHEKILATVAAVVESFTKEHPEALIYVEGSSPSRTRLYRICISKYWKDITTVFQIFGLQNNTWEDFTQNSTYNAFLGARK